VGILVTLSDDQLYHSAKTLDAGSRNDGPPKCNAAIALSQGQATIMLVGTSELQPSSEVCGHEGILLEGAFMALCWARLERLVRHHLLLLEPMHALYIF
jgi:hypothetical protein